MVDTVTIQKWEGRRTDMYDWPLHWQKSILDGEEVIWVSCANGHLSFLQHDIADDGTVKPSLLCQDCGWHVWAKLEDWN